MLLSELKIIRKALSMAFDKQCHFKGCRSKLMMDGSKNYCSYHNIIRKAIIYCEDEKRKIEKEKLK